MGTITGANTFPASITSPDDGVADTAADVNVTLEGLADRTVYLKTRVDVLVADTPEFFLANYQVCAGSNLTTTTLVQPTTMHFALQFGSFGASGTGTGTSINPVTVAVGDIVEVSIWFAHSVQVSGAVTLKLRSRLNGGSQVDVDGTPFVLQGTALSVASNGSLSMQGVLPIASAGILDFLADFTLTSSTGGDHFQLSTYSVVQRVWRPV